jgi:hypothetical protein
VPALLAEGNWSYNDIKTQKIHGTMDEHLEVFRQYHSNYAHLYFDAASYIRAIQGDRAVFERSLQAGGIGYRLVPTSIAWPESIAAGHLFMSRQTWVNRNVGRCYKRFPLAFYFVDKSGKTAFTAVDPSFDQTDWVRGETYENISVVTIDPKLPPGDYELRIALVDKAGVPGIALGIEGDDGQKRYVVGSVRVLPPDGHRAWGGLGRPRP